MIPQGRGKLVNAALLSLINEACVNVCCATLLSSELVSPACAQARLSNPRGRACRPSGKGSGEEGILSSIVPVYLYCSAFGVSVFLCLIQACMLAGRPATQHTSHRRPGPNVSGTCGQGLHQPTNMQPGTYDDLRTKKFFRLWSVTVELVAALCSWFISDNDAVLHTSEDFSVSPSILYLA